MAEIFIDTEEVEIYCKVMGDGEPIIFIHGGPGMTHDYFLYPEFTDTLISLGYKLIFYDQRGCGRTQCPIDKNYLNTRRMICDMESLRKNLHLDRVNVFGHSYGSYLAMHYCTQYAKHVKKTILCNSAPFRAALMLEAANEVNNRLVELNLSDKIRNKSNSNAPSDFMEVMLLRAEAEFHDSRLIGRLARLMKNVEIDPQRFVRVNGLLAQDYLSNVDKFNVSEVCTPIMVIHGASDFIPLSSSKLTVSMVRNGVLDLIPECGHFPFLEKSAELAEMVDRFLKEL